VGFTQLFLQSGPSCVRRADRNQDLAADR